MPSCTMWKQEPHTIHAHYIPVSSRTLSYLPYLDKRTLFMVTEPEIKGDALARFYQEMQFFTIKMCPDGLL